MRKRNKKMILRLNEKEFQNLTEKVEKSGLSRNAYCLEKFLAVEVIPAPSADYITLIAEANRVGTRINQVLQKSNAAGFLDIPMLHDVLEESNSFNKLLGQNFGGNDN